jgi:hypothetical protein
MAMLGAKRKRGQKILSFKLTHCLLSKCFEHFVIASALAGATYQIAVRDLSVIPGWIAPGKVTVLLPRLNMLSQIFGGVFSIGLMAMMISRFNSRPPRR